MNFYDLTYLFLYILAFLITTPLLGQYLVAVYTGKVVFFSYIEKFSYRIAGVKSDEEMTWSSYARNLICLNLLGFIALFCLFLFQGYLPLNPQKFSGTSFSLAFNAAASFMTNTDWQSYSGESTLSYFTQLLGITVQNFLSASTGMCALLVFIRGFIRKNENTVGNFWSDLMKTILYVLLPLSILFAPVLVMTGVIQTIAPYAEVVTLENEKQIIPLGPVASQVAIKQLGSNGGGFFNANSAHPFENPSGISNFIEHFAIILIPAALVYFFGVMVGSKKHGLLIFATMFLFWIMGILVSNYSTYVHNPIILSYPILEGKESRFGISQSVQWAVTTTATSNGSVNSSLSSLSPLTGGIAMFNIKLGEQIFGGIGVGMCIMLMFIFLTVFISGLMVGRTPEYLGKKIEKYEMQWVIIATLVPVSLILIGSGITTALYHSGNKGPHGLSEILYAFASAAGNNGSSFASLNFKTPYFNIFLGIIMMLTRFTIIFASLAISGSLVTKKTTPPSLGTFSTNSFLFFLLLIGIIFIFGALVFFPSLCLGPIVEHLLMLNGKTF